MDLTEYLRILARRGWIMLALAVIVGGTAYFLSKEQTPVYQATQKVVIQPSRTDLGLAEAAVRLLNSLVVIINSRTVAGGIIEQERLDIDPGALLGNTSIAPDQLRLTIQIDVKSEDQDLAFRAARAWGQYLVDYRDELNQTVQREDRVIAVLPDNPTMAQIAPRPTFLGIAGALLGLLVGAVIVFVLEYLESGLVRRRDDLERANLSVLAVVPSMDSRTK